MLLIKDLKGQMKGQMKGRNKKGRSRRFRTALVMRIGQCCLEAETDSDGRSREGAVVVAVSGEAGESRLGLDHRVVVRVGEGVYRRSDEEAFGEVVVHAHGHCAADVERLPCGLAHPCLVVHEGDVVAVGVARLDAHEGKKALHLRAEVPVEAQGDVELHGVLCGYLEIVGDGAVTCFPCLVNRPRDIRVSGSAGEAEPAADVQAPQVEEEPSELHPETQGLVVPVGGYRRDRVGGQVARLGALHHAGVVARGHREREVVAVPSPFLGHGHGACEKQRGGQHG